MVRDVLRLEDRENISTPVYEMHCNLDNRMVWLLVFLPRYLGRLCPAANLEGNGEFETGLVDQWVEFAANEMSYMQV